MAFGVAEFSLQKRQRIFYRLLEKLCSGKGVSLAVAAHKLRVVVEHLHEVRDEPPGVDAVAGKPTAELVVESAVSHPLEGEERHLLCPWFRAREEKLEACVRRKLGRVAEPAVHRI